MLPGEYAQGSKNVGRSNREKALKRESPRRVARGESLDGLLGYISGLLVEVASPTRKIVFEANLMGCGKLKQPRPLTTCNLHYALVDPQAPMQCIHMNEHKAHAAGKTPSACLLHVFVFLLN